MCIYIYLQDYTKHIYSVDIISHTSIVYIYCTILYLCTCNQSIRCVGILREGDDGVAPHILRRPLRLYAIQNPPRWLGDETCQKKTCNMEDKTWDVEAT